MKKIFLAVATALAMFSCSQKEPVTVTITNPLSIDRNGEMVEISMAEITGKLQLPDTAQVIVLDENGLEVPYQITYDDMLIFPASVKGDASAVYTIAEGTPQPVDVVACGRQYPERLDDVAWEDSTIVYPYCYKDCEILDNGPLRFTAKLVYNPLVVKGDSSVIETRIISLDKGSQLNKTVVSFDNLQEITPVVTGIVLHKQNPMGYSFDADAGYIAYADSTENAANNNGVIYIGAVFPATVKGAFAQVFSEKERKERGDALGHVLAVNDYEPGAEYIYYWGSGWSKYGFEADTDWNKYLEEYARKIRNPLAVAIK